MYQRLNVELLTVIFLICGCPAFAQKKKDTVFAGKTMEGYTMSIAPGEDWSLPPGTQPAVFSGFFSESLHPSYHVNVRSVDVSWRQLNPEEGVYRTDLTGSAQGMSFPSLDQQLSTSDPFWMRIWASGVDWAPTWVVTDCGITSTWQDYDSQYHIPIWNPCVWNHLMALYRHLFIDQNLRADPRLVMLYSPGAFTWCEFDYEIVEQAAADGLTFETFHSWFQTAMPEMVSIFNGENSNSADDYARKLVFTGEDYPWGPWDGQANLLATEAVSAGQGIRTGITELFNFHLNQTPAYGATIAQDGHIVVDESWPILSDGRVLATENECYNDCGYTTSEPWYAVKMSNLKALQLRVNWLYVVPLASYMSQYPEHWEWVRLSLGHTPQTSPDAWVALREFQDMYWDDEDSHDWPERPWIHNFERWLVQKDLTPDGQTRRGSEVHTGVLAEENGTSYEGRRTDLAHGQNAMYFFVDDHFIDGAMGTLELNITYLDTPSGSWSLEYQNHSGTVQTQALVQTGTNSLKTAIFRLRDAVLSNGLAQQADFRIINSGTEDVELQFVRLVKVPDIFHFENWPAPSSVLDFVAALNGPGA